MQTSPPHSRDILLSSVCRQLAVQQTWQLPAPTALPPPACWAPCRAQGFLLPMSGRTLGFGGKHPQRGGPAGGRDSARALWRGTNISHCTAPTQKHISQPQTGSCFTFCSNRHTGCAGNQAGLAHTEPGAPCPAARHRQHEPEKGPGALGQCGQSAPYLHCIQCCSVPALGKGTGLRRQAMLRRLPALPAHPPQALHCLLATVSSFFGEGSRNGNGDGGG